MSTQYTILFENQTGADANYGFFVEPPGFQKDSQSWMTVWQTSSVPNQESHEIRTVSDWFIWVGFVTTRPAPGVIVGTGMAKLTRLGTEDSPGSSYQQEIVHNIPIFSEIEPSAGVGAFSIKTADDIPQPNDRYLIGVAKITNRGQVVPIGFMAPGSNEEISVVPKMKLFIAQAQTGLVPGEIVDYDAIVRDAATIDFSKGEGQGKFSARVVHGSNGSFTVTFV